MRGLSTPFVTGGLYPFENLFPAFDPPDAFELRLGFGSDDEFLSGTFPVGNKKIGFIRIPWMDPASGESNALKQFAAEIAYFQANTDGLVVDIMANGGGDGCYSQDLASYLVPHNFRGLELKLRATLRWQYAFSYALTVSELQGAPQWVIDLYSAHLGVVQKALSENRGLTGNVAVCGPSFDTPPATDETGKVLAYTKPILVLVDNYTLSAAEIFAMFLQDEKRATIFGTRTDGGGGDVLSFNAGAYSEAFTRVTESLITRSKAVQTPGYPALTSYDGVGIFPDIVADYMTLGNLETGGQPFRTNAMTAIAGLIQAAGH